ncbi:unnamed protein product [Trichogramma brassicae]|uniref:Peptidase S1 domain-containing protein n=1 Tax=Trichogramma brassicae TaxID=86971 RepID=A0A6H5IJL3_9HYME|nr:unnamed protein product [Trichogramma brassicae]
MIEIPDFLLELSRPAGPAELLHGRHRRLAVRRLGRALLRRHQDIALGRDRGAARLHPGGIREIGRRHGRHPRQGGHRRGEIGAKRRRAAGLVRLKEISPLPRSHVFGEGDTSLVAGYGCSRNEDPTKLKYTMMKPIDHETCGVNYLLGDDDSVFCAAVTAANAGSAVCQGDDGTPYVHKSGVVGILSYVPSDRSSDAIFTKVGAYEQFIKRAMTEKIDHTIKVVDYRS